MASQEALKGKLQVDVDLKLSADQFYKMWRSDAHKIPSASSQNVQAVHLHEGDWDSHGAIKVWNYTVEGKAEVFKEKVEFDDDNMIVTLHGIEGDILKEFKVYKLTCKVVPKTKVGAVAKLAIEYERFNEDVPIPNHYMKVFVSMNEDIDAHAYTAVASA